jgi:hypothetical protein
MLGGGSGHIQDMNNRLRDNKKMRTKRRTVKDKHDQISHAKRNNSPLKYNSNPVQFSKVKKRIQQQRKKDALITRVVLWISILVIFLLVGVMFVEWGEE